MALTSETADYEVKTTDTIPKIVPQNSTNAFLDPNGDAFDLSQEIDDLRFQLTASPTSPETGLYVNDDLDGDVALVNTGSDGKVEWDPQANDFDVAGRLFGVFEVKTTASHPDWPSATYHYPSGSEWIIVDVTADGATATSQTLADLSATLATLDVTDSADFTGATVTGLSVSGSDLALDLGDDGSNESSGLTEFATTGDTNGVFSEDAADKLLADLTQNWPGADDVPDSAVDHDATTNYVANEHVDHSTVSVTGTGSLTGGGDLTTSRTLDIGTGGVDTAQLAAEAVSEAKLDASDTPSDGEVLAWNASASQFEWVPTTLYNGGTVTDDNAYNISTGELVFAEAPSVGTNILCPTPATDEHFAVIAGDDTNGITIQANASEDITVGGETSSAISLQQGTSVIVWSDGTDWNAVAADLSDRFYDPSTGNLTANVNATTVTAATLQTGGASISASGGTVTISVSGDPTITRPEMASAPAAAPAGEWRDYYKSDGLYFIDDAGTETGPLGTGGGSSGPDYTASASAQATLDVTGLSQTAHQIKFYLSGFVPATDGVDLYIRVRDTGTGTWQSDGGDYQYTVRGNDSAVNSTNDETASATEIRLTTTGVGNAAGEALWGELALSNPGDGGTFPTIYGDVSYITEFGNTGRYRVAGSYLTAEAIDGIRVAYTSGNITSGDIDGFDKG